MPARHESFSFRFLSPLRAFVNPFGERKDRFCISLKIESVGGSKNIINACRSAGSLKRDTHFNIKNMSELYL